MTTAEYLQNLVNDNKFLRELAQFYGEDISSSAGLAEIAKALVHTEPTTQQYIIVDSAGKSLPVCATSKVFLDKISGNVDAISMFKVAPYNVKIKTGVKILAEGTIITQAKIDELSRFEVQIYDNGKPIGKQLNTQFMEGEYQIAFTITSTTTSCNFGISGRKADAKMTFKLPAPGDYIYHFTTAMNTDGTQRWYNMRITLPDGTPYIDEDGLVAAYIIPEEIKAISGYGEYNPANTEEYNYIDGSDGSYVIVGRKINGIWTTQDEERVPVAFNPWLATNDADIIRIEGNNLATNSSILCRTYNEPKEKHTATLAFNLSGTTQGFDYATLYVNDQEYKEKITSASAIQLPIGAKVKIELFAKDGYKCTASIAPNNYSIDLAQEWNIFEDATISITIEAVLPTYTLTLNGVDSEGVNDYSIYINEILQPKQTTYQILKDSFVQVQFDIAWDEVTADITSSSGMGGASLGTGWYMTNDETVTVSTSKKCYILNLNGIDSEGIKDYDVKINGEYQPKQTVYQILSGSFVQVSIDADITDYYYDFNSNIGGEADAGDGWYMDQDVTITVTTSRKCYTLTLNLAGDYEAFGQDGYTIYVDGGEFDRTDSSGTYSIPAGATVSTYNNSMHTHGYEYSETITPTPSYNEDGSWIMDRDYEITVTATPDEEIIYYTINTSWEENSGVDYTDIVFKDPVTGEWDYNTGSKATSLTLPQNTEYYIVVGCYSDYSHTGYGSENNPLALTDDIAFNIVPTYTPAQVTITIVNPYSGYTSYGDYLTFSIDSFTQYGQTHSDTFTMTKDTGSEITYDVDYDSVFKFSVVDDSHPGSTDYYIVPQPSYVESENGTAFIADKNYTINFILGSS